MLVIRMQRTGRSGHAMFRVVVQDSRRTPTSGKLVAALGSYDPHTKAVAIDKDKAQFYLDHGAQPSPRAASLLKEQGVKLPKWVVDAPHKERSVRNADKRRSTRPPEPVAEAEPEAPAEGTAEPAPAAQDEPASDSAPKEEAETEAAADETAAEVPAEQPEAEVTPAEAEASEPEAETPAKPAVETPEEAESEDKPAKKAE